MIEIKVNELSSFVRSFRDIEEKFPVPWWRGHYKSSWQLLPSALREPSKGMGAEASNLAFFKSRIPLHHPSRLASEADLPFLAQHYGLKTRLLDWTEGAAIALYFALMTPDGKYPGDDYSTQEDAAVWVLNAQRLNQVMRGNSELLSPEEEEVRNIFSRIGRFGAQYGTPERVIATYGNVIDWRMHMQLSVFTLHDSPQPLEEHPDADQFLAKITIPKFSRHYMLKQLALMGLRPDSIFPDMEHIAMHLNANTYDRHDEEIRKRQSKESG